MHGPALNPRQPPNSEPKLKAAGGSSGGSAAAVAAGFCDVYVMHYEIYLCVSDEEQNPEL